MRKENVWEGRARGTNEGRIKKKDGFACEQTRRLSGSSLEEAEQVPTGFADGCHLGNNGEIVDYESNLITLLTCQILCVS